MSFSSLPGELLDLVALNVRDSASSDGLAKLCLVSRQTLPSARRALYEKPFVGMAEWHTSDIASRAKRFLASLQARQGQLGGLVRNTSGIYRVFWSSGLADNSSGKIHQSEGKEEEEEEEEEDHRETWYLDVLRICPNLQEVDILFWSDRVLESTLQALKTSIPTIQHIKLRGADNLARPEQPPQPSTAFRLFRLYLTRPLLHLEIQPNQWLNGASVPTFEVPLNTKSLSMTLHSTLADRIPENFPSPAVSTSLKKVILLLIGNPYPTATPLLPSISKLFGRSIEKFFVIYYIPSPRLRLDSYGRQHPESPLPPDVFRDFPKLVNLKLVGFHGPSQEFLETLSEHAPLLRNINLSGSIWISLSKPTSTIPDEVFPEHKVVETLRKFKHLQFINLGTLPTLNRERYTWIVEEMKKIGVSVKFEVCMS
ncbi:hypothetical protein JCM3765_003812 [Sporobolomyces pararoseus]